LDHLTLQKLAYHKEVLELLVFWGQVLNMVTTHPKFPKPELTQQVQAIQFILRDSYASFHGPNLSREKAEKIEAAFARCKASLTGWLKL
jgi:hypothetical protein